MVTLGTCSLHLWFLQKIAYMGSTTNAALRESNVASQEKYTPGNYKITSFMVATHTVVYL